MKKWMAFFALAALLFSFAGCGGGSSGDFGDTVMVEITMQDGGVIRLELYPEVAPITVENFTTLVSEGFYDGLIFHRVISGFWIQGGDPTGTGYGDPNQKKIKGEFASNGVKNDIAHTRGTISMARSNNKNSATSQFFIMHQDASHLDGEYAAFGRVVDGIEVVDAIASVAVDYNYRPMVEQKIATIRMIEE